MLDKSLNHFNYELKYRPANILLPEPPKNDPNYVLIENSDFSFRRMSKEEREREVGLPHGTRIFRFGPLQSDGASKTDQTLAFEGGSYHPGKNALDGFLP